MIPHYIHIHHKPKNDDYFIRRLQAYNYRHQICCNGWYDTASCDVALTPIEAELALENWPGNIVKMYVDNPAEPIWEGLISTVTYEAGGARFRRSLDAMMNRAEVVWQAAAAAAGSQTQITSVNNLLPSQAIYGIKEGSIDAYYQENQVVTTGRVNTLRDTLINVLGWPQTSISQSTAPQIVRLELVGFYHTLEWEMWWNTPGSANITPTQMILNALAAVTNGTLWFNNADTSGVTTNAAFTSNNRFRIGMTKWQGIQYAQECGDGTNYWITGIEPTNPVKGTRRLYYRQCNSAIEYTCRASDGLRVRNIAGGLVRPWLVKPDRVIRLTDALVGWNAQGDDPRETYIRNVAYDAERQQVTWQGADDTSGEGVFQVKHFYQRHDNKFSQSKVRTIYN